MVLHSQRFESVLTTFGYTITLRHVPLHRAPAAVVTGQPGIGEFSFSLYQTVTNVCVVRKGRASGYIMHCVDALQKGSQSSGIENRIVFCLYKMACREAPPEFRPCFNSFVWTLVDSDETERVPSHLVPHGTRLYTIFSTSPSVKRWSRLHKTVRLGIIIMNPWTKAEIRYA